MIVDGYRDRQICVVVLEVPPGTPLKLPVHLADEFDVLLRLVWNFTWRERQIGDGVFMCPHCKAEQKYTLIEYRRWFAFFNAPVIKLKDWYHRVQCASCRRKFEDFVLGTSVTA